MVIPTSVKGEGRFRLGLEPTSPWDLLCPLLLLQELESWSLGQGWARGSAWQTCCFRGAWNLIPGGGVPEAVEMGVWSSGGWALRALVPLGCCKLSTHREASSRLRALAWGGEWWALDLEPVPHDRS